MTTEILSLTRGATAVNPHIDINGWWDATEGIIESALVCGGSYEEIRGKKSSRQRIQLCPSRTLNPTASSPEYLPFLTVGPFSNLQSQRDGYLQFSSVLNLSHSGTRDPLDQKLTDKSKKLLGLIPPAFPPGLSI